MPSIFDPNDHVEISLGIALGPPGTRLTGRVVAFCNPGPGDDGRMWLYTVLLDAPYPGYAWPAMVAAGAQLRKLSVLETMAIASEAKPSSTC